MARIGLVAGEGRLPIVFARVAKEKGDTVIAFGLKGITSPDLEKAVDKLFILFQRPFDQARHVAERIVHHQIAQAQGLVGNQPGALVFDAGSQVSLNGL